MSSGIVASPPRFLDPKRLLDAVEQAVIATDIDGRILFWNRFAERLYGWAEDEVLGRCILQVTPAPELAAQSREIMARLAQGESWSGEFKVHRRDGSIFYAHLADSPIRDAEGRLVGVVGISYDVTERRQASERERFLSQLNDGLRPLTGAEEVMGFAAQALGAFHEASRVGFGEVDEERGYTTIERDWCAHGLPSIAGRYAFGAFGSDIGPLLRAGLPLIVADIRADPRTAATVAAHLAVGAAALLTVPIIRERRLVAFMFIHQAEPRAWNDGDLALAEQVAERVWTAVERARAATALRALNQTLEQRVVERTQALAEANRRLLQNEESMSALFQKAPVPMHSLDSQRRLIDVNDQWLELFGYAREEVLGRSISDFHLPGLEPIHEARWHEVMQLGLIRAAERQFVKKTGDVFDAVVTARAEFEADGAFVRTITVTTDVTARKRAEEAARRERQLSELLIESSTGGIIGLDKEFRYTMWNPAVEAMSGIPREKLLGRSFFEVRSDLLGTPIEAAWRATMQGHRTTLRDRPYDFPLSAHKGVYEVEFAPLYGPDRTIVGGLAFLRDTTERRRAEEELRRTQRLEAMGQLTAGVAHDFNNLLTAIFGNLERLEHRHRGDEQSLRMVAAAQRAADRGARLTSQLLAFSRKQRMTPEAIDLNHVVSGMGSLLQSTIGSTVRIETVLAGDLWSALADPSQIELVILNLAINARDAMPAGGTMTIKTANATLGLPSRPEEPPAGDHVMISVADTGTGIASEILDRVFEPFFTTKEIGRGSGLGLAQVLGVAQQLGGGVRLATRAGEGTVFEVFLPRALSSLALAGEQVPRERRESISSGGDVAILLVDDDDEVRSITASMLRDAGYDVVEAASGSAGLEKLERDGKRIELMVVDFAMPGMNGVEVAERARRMRPGVPILFITGFADTAMLAEHASPEEILQKPFRTAEIATRVARMLGRSSEPGNEAVSLEPRLA